jgi:hypothetical protein
VPPLAAVDVARADFTQVLALIPLLAHEQESDAESSYENESDGGDPESYTLGYNLALVSYYIMPLLCLRRGDAACSIAPS